MKQCSINFKAKIQNIDTYIKINSIDYLAK